MAVTAKRIWVLLVLLSFVGMSHTASADSFVPVPAAKGSSNKQLKMRFVTYDGGTNGQMVIEVKNTGKAAQRFSADGIYFVPTGDPDKAPQRLGASGPMLVMAGTKTIQQSTRSVNLNPGETKQVRLEVFCIDSHRSSPNRSTKFTIASTLLPSKLRRSLHFSNAKIYRKHKYNLPAAKNEIQGNMWKTRDAKWMKLQGERAVEKTPPSPHQRRMRHQRIEFPAPQ